MSTLHIPDGLLEKAGITEKEALVELACRLFDTGKLTLPAAGKLAGLARIDMEAALLERAIAIYRPTVEDFEKELKTLEKYGSKGT